MTEQGSNKIVITTSDVARVREEPRPASAPVTPTAPSGSRDWGTVHGASAPVTSAVAGGSVFYKAWFYLPLAGLLGAFAGWAVAEPFLDDRAPSMLASYVMDTAVAALMCILFAAAEAVIEQNPRKALTRVGIALAAVLVLVLPLDYFSNVIYRFLMQQIPNRSLANPLEWMARAIAWGVFGLAGGVTYGIVGQSIRQATYGAIGGFIGAFIGGLAFNPILMAVEGAEASRGVAFSVFGALTGLAIGLVENALKNRWLYVAQGPLAGKQFILYKPVTVFGNDRACDIYLFKDPTILPQHAAIQVQGAQAMLTAAGPTTINGRPVISPNVRLRSGDQVQIGRYVFRYEETNKVA